MSEENFLSISDPNLMQERTSPFFSRLFCKNRNPVKSKFDPSTNSIKGLFSQIISQSTQEQANTLEFEIKSSSLLGRVRSHEKSKLHYLFSLKISDSLERSPFLSSSNLDEYQDWFTSHHPNLIPRLNKIDKFYLPGIFKIHNPILLEQILDLSYLLSTKSVRDQDAKRILQVVLDLIEIGEDGDAQCDSGLIKEIHVVLGQLIYLTDVAPVKVISLINERNLKKTLLKVNHEFNLYILNLCQKIKTLSTSHEHSELQSSEVAMHTAIPVEIATILITSCGTINVGIIKSLSSLFLNVNETPLNFDLNLSYALNLLKNSSRLRSEIESIKAPKEAMLPSNEIIRATLNLSPHIHISSRESRIVALAALLSHPRQGSEGSCFAVSLAIEILSAHLLYSLKDIKQLLEEGKLTRKIKQIATDIPFCKRINDLNLNHTLQLYEDGLFSLSGFKPSFLWDSPGFQSACLSLGLKDKKIAFQHLLERFPVSKNNKRSVRELLQQLSIIASEESNESKELLFSRACLYFSSQTNQLLLKAWENTIANMAETEESGMVKRSIVKAALNAFQNELTQLKTPKNKSISQFLVTFQHLIFDRIHLRYDPTIQTPSPSNHESHQLNYGNEGGFVLFDQNCKIDNEYLFKSFMKQMLDSTLQETIEGQNELNKKAIKECYEVLMASIRKESFMRYLLACYHPSNKGLLKQTLEELPLNTESLLFTPWISQTGNNSKSVLKTFFESETTFSSKKIVLQKDTALKEIINYCKDLCDSEKQKLTENVNRRSPLCIPGKHRFPFMAGHLSLARAWKDKCSTDDWIEENIKRPIKEIAEERIDLELKQRWLESIEREVLLKRHTANEPKLILTALNSIPTDISIQDFRNQVLIKYQNTDVNNKISINSFKQAVDSCLISSLSVENQQKFAESAVYVADTNWSSGIHDLYFCFAMNPGSGKIEFWKSQSDKMRFDLLDQNYWIHNQIWVFYNIPEETIPDDFFNNTLKQ